jgi:hypothetical protein
VASAAGQPGSSLRRVKIMLAHKVERSQRVAALSLPVFEPLGTAFGAPPLGTNFIAASSIFLSVAVFPL